MEPTKRAFFTRDTYFYKTICRLMIAIILQNLVAYSVNMADNLMLGGYSQDTLSGAATVNQIQFMVQQLTMAIGDSIVVLGGQYWGKKEVAPIRSLTFYALIGGILLGGGVFIWTSLDPRGILMIFTKNEAYIAEGMEYLRLIRFTYPIYTVTAILMASLRTTETVGLALKVSLASLVLDVVINYGLIFGKFGCPELGIRGAAIGTLTARIAELIIVLGYMVLKDKKLKLFTSGKPVHSRELLLRYLRVLFPSALSNMLWSIATPIQTSVLGRLSDDAIAANSVSTTIYQYLKIVAIGAASASSVLIGKTVGETQDNEKLKEYSRTLQIMYISCGILLGTAVFLLRIPFLSLYELTPKALEIADGMLIVLSFAMVGMAYQMPVCIGIIRGGGDVTFTMYLNIISTWLIVMPLTFIAAFVWKLSPVFVVLILNSDQIFKCLPVAIRCNRYRWIKRLTQ